MLQERSQERLDRLARGGHLDAFLAAREEEVEAERDRERAAAAGELEALPARHEKAIAAAGKRRDAADRKLAEAELARNLVVMERAEAWSLAHAAESTRDNAMEDCRRKLRALAPEIAAAADFKLRRLEVLVRGAFISDVSYGEPNVGGARPVVHTSNAEVIRGLLRDAAHARSRLDDAIYAGSPFAELRALSGELLEGLMRKRIVATLPHLASEVGLILGAPPRAQNGNGRNRP